MKTLASNNGTLDEWVLLSRPDDIVEGLKVKFFHAGKIRSNYKQIGHPELEDRIWSRIKNTEIEPKLGYHAHLATQGSVAVELREDSDWPTFLATNLDHEVFIPDLLGLYNSINRKSYSLQDADKHEHFWRWASRYVDGTLAQAGALETPSGIAVALRSDDVGHYPGYWHTFGSFLPGEGEPLHRRGIVAVNGKPLTAVDSFQADESTLLEHSKVNLYHETGILPEEAEWAMTGLGCEFPHQTAEFIYHIKSPVEIQGLDWQHRNQATRHLNGLGEILDFLTAERKIVPAGQLAIVAAAIRNRPEARDALLEAGVISEVEIADNYLNPD